MQPERLGDPPRRCQPLLVQGEPAAAAVLGAAHGETDPVVGPGEAVHRDLRLLQARHHQPVHGLLGRPQRLDDQGQRHGRAREAVQLREGEGIPGDHPEAHTARAGRRLEARPVAARLQLLHRVDQLLGRADPPPRRHRHADGPDRLVGDHLVTEQGHRLRRRREQGRTRRLELRAVRHDRRLVQPGHEHVDAAPRALVQRVLDVPRGGQALRLQVGGVRGGQHGGVRIAVRGMDLDGPVGGISPELINEEDVLRVRAVEPDAYGRSHASRLPGFAGRAKRAVPGQGFGGSPSRSARGMGRGGGVGAIIGVRVAPSATRVTRMPRPGRAAASAAGGAGSPCDRGGACGLVASNARRGRGGG